MMYYFEISKEKADLILARKKTIVVAYIKYDELNVPEHESILMVDDEGFVRGRVWIGWSPWICDREVSYGLCLKDDTLTTWHEDYTDQLQYGDFEVGRYAWLIQDVMDIYDSCPNPECAGGSVPLPYTDSIEATCKVCNGYGSLHEPISFAALKDLVE